MAVHRLLRNLAVTGVVASSILVGGVAVAAPASAATCSDVELVFARGSGEVPGLGIVGSPLLSSLQQDLPGKTVTSYAVNYAADIAQTSAGAGATDMTRHVTQVAGTCPATSFVIGGYSQGASVTDIAIGLPTFLGTGQVIPTDLAPRIAAVVVFGNPARLAGGRPITTGSALYGSRAFDKCNTGDPVCGGGALVTAHLTYGFDGGARDGAAFAANLVNAAGSTRA